MKQCPRCGAENPDERTWCIQCLKNLDVNLAEQYRVTESKLRGGVGKKRGAQNQFEMANKAEAMAPQAPTVPQPLFSAATPVIKPQKKRGYIIISCVAVLLVALLIPLVSGLFSIGTSAGHTADNPITGLFKNSYVKEGSGVLMPCKPSDGIYGISIARERIATISFLSSTRGAEADAKDVSVAQDGSVLMWAEQNSNNMYDLFFAADGTIELPADCGQLFAYYSNATSISFNGNVDTSKVEDMHNMFDCCMCLTKVDLTGADTSSVTNMKNMFAQCYNLEEIIIDYFDTSASPSCNGILSGCSNLDIDTLHYFGEVDPFAQYRKAEKVPSSLSEPTPMVAAGNYHSLYLRSDGTVMATGSGQKSDEGNRGSRLDVDRWTDVVEISAASHSVGLRSDGTVVACGVNGEGQCNVSGWRDIVDISAGNYHTVGLRSDGTVVAVGNNEYGQCNVSGWTNIVDVAAGEYTTYGLRANGTIVSAGQKKLGSTWQNIRAISASAYNLVGLREDGTVVAAGAIDKWEHSTIDTWADIVQVSVSNTHVLGLRSDGTVAGCGNTSYTHGQWEVDDWKDIVQISAGLYHTMALKSDGTILSIGSNAFGQLDLANG